MAEWVWGIIIVGACAWWVVASEIRIQRRHALARGLVRRAQGKLGSGHNPIVVGAELHYRAYKLNCSKEVSEMWSIVEADIEEKSRGHQ